MSSSAPRKISISTLLFLVLASSVVMACGGCGQSMSAGKSAVLDGIDAVYIERHGHLYFVNDVKLGCQLAAQNQMPCLFFFTAKWCTFCHRMAETAFADSAVGELGQNFVCVVVDADREQQMCSYFAVTGFPTVELVSPQGHSLLRLVGQQSSENLAAGMRAALGRYAWISGSQLK